MSTDLVSWLRAQLDADEATARAVKDNSAPWDGQWKADGPDRLRTYNDWVLFYGHTHPLAPGLVDHVALHDPRRVLADVDAKRRIIDVHVDQRECERCAWFDDEHYPCETLQLLGLPYADRAGYDESWRP
jgi:hypothetical protein